MHSKNPRMLPKAQLVPTLQTCLATIILCTLTLSSSLSANTGSVHVKIQPVNMPCAAIFEVEEYKGYSHILSFPGSTSRIDLGYSSEDKQRVKSISVKSGCTALLWGKEGGPRKRSGFLTYAFADSVSFVQDDTQTGFEWACCYCDKCSESVCIASHQLTRNAIPPTEQQNYFSQFVRFSKKVIGIEHNFRSKNETEGDSDIPKEPIVFLKPTTSFIRKGRKIILPQSLGPMYYEVELGVVIRKRGKNIPESEALDYVAGYFIAVDMMAAEFVTGKVNKTNRPWALGKVFDTSCPVGNFIPKSLIPDPNNVQLETRLNGNLTRSTNTKDMIFKVQQLISYVSKYMTLEPFDTFLTGSPDGLGQLKSGDVVQGRIGNIASIEFQAVAVT